MKTVKLAILGALLLVALVTFGNLSLFSVGGVANPGNKITHFTIKDYYGNSWCTHEFEDKVTILTFWFPTCPSCLQELPRLEAIWNEYKDAGLKVVAVEATGQREASQRFIKQNGLSYTFLENGKEGEEVVESLFRIEMFPTTLIVDKAGIVRHRHTGFRPGFEKQLISEIKDLLNE